MKPSGEEMGTRVGQLRQTERISMVVSSILAKRVSHAATDWGRIWYMKYERSGQTVGGGRCRPATIYDYHVSSVAYFAPDTPDFDETGELNDEALVAVQCIRGPPQIPLMVSAAGALASRSGKASLFTFELHFSEDVFLS